MQNKGIKCVTREVGRIVIPEHIRIQLNIKNRDTLLVYIKDEILVLKNTLNRGYALRKIKTIV